MLIDSMTDSGYLRVLSQTWGTNNEEQNGITFSCTVFQTATVTTCITLAQFTDDGTTWTEESNSGGNSQCQLHEQKVRRSLQDIIQGSELFSCSSWIHTGCSRFQEDSQHWSSWHCQATYGLRYSIMFNRHKLAAFQYQSRNHYLCMCAHVRCVCVCVCVCVRACMRTWGGGQSSYTNS